MLFLGVLNIKLQRVNAINFLGHKTINLVDTFHKFEEKLKKQQSPFFIYHHVMDLHDYENFNSISTFFSKLLNYPKWFKFSRDIKKKRKFLYDSSLMQVDKYVGKILNILDPNTLLFITSDHGHRKSLKIKLKDLTFQMITLMKCMGKI